MISERKGLRNVLKHINLPNCITILRILGTLGLIFLPPMSIWFFVLYAFAGFTDVLDGYIARRTHTTSEIGAKLDSIADLLFYSVMLLKIFPILLEKLPLSMWITIAAIVVLRLAAYGVAALKYHRFASLHTWMNKATGAIVFGIPYMIGLPVAIPYCWTGCLIAGLASAEELLLHLFVKNYSTKIKSILDLKKVRSVHG